MEQVKGGKPVTLTVGQTFFEGPDDIHIVGHKCEQHQARETIGRAHQEEGRSAGSAGEVSERR